VVLVNEPARSIGSNTRMLLYHFGSLEELLAGALRAWPEVNRPVHF
jgi:hypothetical protein